MGAVDLSGGATLDLSGGAPPASGGSYGHGGGASGLGGQMAQTAFQMASEDPAVQQQLKQAAYTQAEQGYSVARTATGQAVAELRHYVQEGPAGVSILCFFGGIATAVVGMLGLLNIATTVTQPFQYLLNAYLAAFGIVTFLLEADIDHVKSMKILGKLAPWVERYQMEVFNRANFLTDLRGRGFFYIFIGCLSITQCFLCLLFVVGAWNLLMGVLCAMMSFGINPADHMNVDRGAQQLQQSEPYA